MVADLFWRMPGVLRSPHFDAVSARGPRAEWITGGLRAAIRAAQDSAIDRIRRVERARSLLLGVGASRQHDAPSAPSWSAVRPIAATSTMSMPRADGVHYGENDSCCEKFELVDDWLRAEGLLREGRVGHAEARLMEAKDTGADSRRQGSGEPTDLPPWPGEGIAVRAGRESLA